MKKVLILAYEFPPYISVGGFRPYSWFKYFKEFDLYPVVVTRQWNNKFGNNLDYIAESESKENLVEILKSGTIIRTPFFPHIGNKLMLKWGEHRLKGLRKILSSYYELMQFHFKIGNKRVIYLAAREYLMKEKVDIIIASGDPYILFSYASDLSREFNIPWIADYRDPWSNDVSLRNVFLKAYFRKLEKRIAASASSITTVSEYMCKRIQSVVGFRKIHVIANGFDEETFLGLQEQRQESSSLNIAFSGTINKWHPLEAFLKVVSSFIKDNPDTDLKLNFYGVNYPGRFDELINGFPYLAGKVNIFPKKPHKELLNELAKNNVMLLFNSYRHMGTKIYDYLALKRNIIFCFSDDKESLNLKKQFYDKEDNTESLQEKVISETKSGFIVKNKEHLPLVLDKLSREIKEKGYIHCYTCDFEKYSRKAQVSLFSKIIHKLKDSLNENCNC